MYPVPDRPMAWSFDPSTVRRFPRPGHQPPKRDRTELKIVTGLYPDKILNQQQTQILKDVMVDGHWLFTMIISYLPKLDLSLDVSRTQFRFQILQVASEIQDLLFNDMVAGLEAEGLTDEQLVRAEGFLEEYLPDLAEPIERIIDEVFVLLSHFEPPPFCLKKDLLKYLSGYSLYGTHAGLLHFDFREP